MRIPIAKASVKDEPGSIDVDLDRLHSVSLREVYYQGLKALANRGMSKITGTKTPESRQDAIKIAEKNLNSFYSGEIRVTGGKAKDVTRAVMTRAMQKARAAVKDAIRRNGLKISHYTAKQVSELAAGIIQSDQGKIFLDEAKIEIENEKKAKPLELDLSNLKADPNLVQKDEERKAKAKAKKEATPKITAAQIAQHVATTRRQPNA
jgi:hypothetical protein